MSLTFSSVTCADSKSPWSFKEQKEMNNVWDRERLEDFPFLLYPSGHMTSH